VCGRLIHLEYFFHCRDFLVFVLPKHKRLARQVKASTRFAKWTKVRCSTCKLTRRVFPDLLRILQQWTKRIEPQRGLWEKNYQFSNSSCYSSVHQQTIDPYIQSQSKQIVYQRHIIHLDTPQKPQPLYPPPIIKPEKASLRSSTTQQRPMPP
jgi:hypothetical protein